MSVSKNTNDIAAAAPIITTRQDSNGKAAAKPIITIDPATGKVGITGNAAHQLAKRLKALRGEHAKTEDRNEAKLIKRDIHFLWTLFVQLVEDLPDGQIKDAVQILGLELEGISFLTGKVGANMRMR